MKAVFADTFFFLAALNPGDAAHGRAIRWSRENERVRVTTAWVLAEVADALALTGDRHFEQAGFVALLV